MTQMRKTNPQHSRDLARLSKTSKDMNFQVKDRYPVMDPLQFHAIVNNPRISRAAQHYRLKFSEPSLDGGTEPLSRQIKSSMDDPTNERHWKLKRKIYGLPGGQTGLFRREARSDQVFRDDIERGGVEPLAHIDLGNTPRLQQGYDPYARIYGNVLIPDKRHPIIGFDNAHMDDRENPNSSEAALVEIDRYVDEWEQQQ
eukprot:SAG11_NODE_7142_length_1187_cov_2.392463_2_plen_199_part_00